MREFMRKREAISAWICAFLGIHIDYQWLKLNATKSGTQRVD